MLDDDEDSDDNLTNEDDNDRTVKDEIRDD